MIKFGHDSIDINFFIPRKYLNVSIVPLLDGSIVCLAIVNVCVEKRTVFQSYFMVALEVNKCLEEFKILVSLHTRTELSK